MVALGGTEPIVKDLPIYLATVQAALIVIVAVPVGLITYIGQRDDSTREIQLYYRDRWRTRSSRHPPRSWRGRIGGVRRTP